MDLLAVVEQQLGSIETSPTSAITDVFYEEPKVGFMRSVADLCTVMVLM